MRYFCLISHSNNINLIPILVFFYFIQNERLTLLPIEVHIHFRHIEFFGIGKKSQPHQGAKQRVCRMFLGIVIQYFF